MSGFKDAISQIYGAIQGGDDDALIQQAEQNLIAQGQISGQDPALAVTTAAGGNMIGAVMQYFTPSNLAIFQSLLNQIGYAFNVSQTVYRDWPGTVRDIWNDFTSGVYRKLGFTPVRSAQNELLAALAPIREAREFVTYRAPRGYVVMEFPQGSGRKVAVKKEFARMLGWKPQPKALLTPSEVKAIQKAGKALEQVQRYALKKGITQKEVSRTTKGLITKRKK